MTAFFVVAFFVELALAVAALVMFCQRPDAVAQHTVSADPLLQSDNPDLPSLTFHTGPYAGFVEAIVAQGWADADLYRRRQHLPGEHHYSEGTS